MVGRGFKSRMSGASFMAAWLCLAPPEAYSQAANHNPFTGAGFQIDLLDVTVAVDQPASLSIPEVRQRIRAALQAGGHAIICRHGATDWLAADINDNASSNQREDRSQQRNLSDLGLAQARSLKSALDEMRVKIGPVFSTFYWRTRDYAAFATGRTPEIRDELLALRYTTIDTWFDFVGQSALRHDTTFIVAHGQPIGALRIPGPPIGEGDCLIARVEKPRALHVVGRLTPGEWRQVMVP